MMSGARPMPLNNVPTVGSMTGRMWGIRLSRQVRSRPGPSFLLLSVLNYPTASDPTTPAGTEPGCECGLHPGHRGRASSHHSVESDHPAGTMAGVVNPPVTRPDVRVPVAP